MLQVSRVTPSAFTDGTVYATIDGHRSNDMRPYAFASDDFGATWRPISSGLPEGSAYVIREDTEEPDLLYLGTEFALWVSWTGGELDPLGELPDGRGLRPGRPSARQRPRARHARPELHRLRRHLAAPADDAGGALVRRHLFDVTRSATQFIHNEDGWFIGGRSYRAPNPEFGAYINYYLRTAAPNVRITITDATGNVVRTLDGPTQPGLHRVVWDLRTEPFGGITDGLAGQKNISQLGAFVIPGEYRVRMNVGGQEQTTRVRVMGDPLVTISDSDRRRLHDMLVTLTEGQRSMAAAMERVEAMSDADLQQTLRTEGNGVRQRLNSVKGELIGSQSAPTVTQAERYDRSRQELEEFLRRVPQADNDAAELREAA
jgi:hypothetical protein